MIKKRQVEEIQSAFSEVALINKILDIAVDIW
jgi:hypothetical protein